MVARKPTPRRAQRSGLERSFRDARRVLSGYLDSGGKQVKDTITSLLKIFDMEGGRSRTKARTPARGGRRAAERPAATARPRKTVARNVASRRGVATRRSTAKRSRGGKTTARS